MSPKIVQVIPTKEFTVYVYFEDGKIVCWDAKPHLSKEVFKVLNDSRFFINSCTIMNDTLAWDVAGSRDTYKCIDIDPETLYGLDSVKENLSIID